MNRDPWRDLLGRVLPWFDPARWTRERERSAQVIDRANRVIAEAQRVERLIRASR